MNEGDRTEIGLLRQEVKKDIELGLANFKVWLFAGLLTNALIVGIPALLAFVSVQSDSSTALALSNDNVLRLDGHRSLIISDQTRLNNVESYLARKDPNFVPIKPITVPR